MLGGASGLNKEKNLRDAFTHRPRQGSRTSHHTAITCKIMKQSVSSKSVGKTHNTEMVGQKKFQDEKRSEWDAVDKIHSEE